MFDYDLESLRQAYSSVGVSTGKIVYVTGNFGMPGLYKEKGKERLLRAHLRAIFDLIGDEGTLVVPTHSWSLCNTDSVFDRNTTPSETGPFTEFVRRQDGAVRQNHPFSSSTALGRKAGCLCENNSLHVYGPQSPFARMIEDDAIFVSVGMPVQRAASIVHHVEFMMGVPYRYVKEFVQRCRIGDEIKESVFYLYVLYRGIDIVRDRNESIFDIYKAMATIDSSRIGRSSMHGFSMADFYRIVTDAFKEDLYLWLRRPPSDRPYRL